MSPFAKPHCIGNNYWQVTLIMKRCTMNNTGALLNSDSSDFSQVEFICARQMTAERLRLLPDWFRRWTVDRDHRKSASLLISRCRCDALDVFVERLFEKLTVHGIVTFLNHSELEDLSQPRWLVLKSRLSASSDAVADTLTGRPGDYVFLHPPNDSEFVRSVTNASSLVDRFFSAFGGLRDTAPHFGSDGFFEQPFPMSQKCIRERYHDERKWLGAKLLHYRDLSEYLILSTSGEVGFRPISNFERIAPYAPTFSEAIIKWIDDPLRGVKASYP